MEKWFRRFSDDCLKDFCRSLVSRLKGHLRLLINEWKRILDQREPMNLRICRCCGEQMNTGAVSAQNPNMCESCCRMAEEMDTQTGTANQSLAAAANSGSRKESDTNCTN